MREEAVRMPKVKSTGSSEPVRKRRPALTPEAREQQMIGMAIDLVEQRLLNGTASSQETTHFLKLGSTKAILEKKKLEKEIELADAKKKDLERQERTEQLFADAIAAMKKYGGHGDDND